jgi:hypothetical protein
MTTAHDLLQQAVAAIKAGDKGRGKQLLLQVLEADERRVDAWLWLALCEDDPELKRNCLERVLEIDPANQLAKRGVRRLDTSGQVRFSPSARKHIPETNMFLAVVIVTGVMAVVYAAILGVRWAFNSGLLSPELLASAAVDLTEVSSFEPATSTVFLGVAAGCLLLSIPVGILAIRASPWWRKRARSRTRSTPPSAPGPSVLAKAWAWVRIVTIAIIHAGMLGFGAALVSGLLAIFTGPGFALLIGSSIGLIIVVAVFTNDVQEASAELRRTGSVKSPKEFFPSGLFSSTSRSYSPLSSNLMSSGYSRSRYQGYGATDDAILPSGYRRSEYREYGATDDDIQFWGLDQPGAPPPSAAGWAAWDVMDAMDADGDGFIDDPFDDPFF